MKDITSSNSINFEQTEKRKCVFSTEIECKFPGTITVDVTCKVCRLDKIAGQLTRIADTFETIKPIMQGTSSTQNFPAEFYNLSETWQRNVPEQQIPKTSYQKANMKKCVTCVWGNLKTEKSVVKCKNCNIFNPEATVCNYDEVPDEIPE